MTDEGVLDIDSQGFIMGVLCGGKHKKGKNIPHALLSENRYRVFIGTGVHAQVDEHSSRRTRTHVEKQYACCLC